MTKTNLEIAQAYYHAMNEKNLTATQKCLHEQIILIGPLGTTRGKQDVTVAITKFQSALQKLTVRTVCSSHNQTMVVYDVDFPLPIGTLASAALLTFKDNLITQIELFFDASKLKGS